MKDSLKSRIRRLQLEIKKCRDDQKTLHRSQIRYPKKIKNEALSILRTGIGFGDLSRSLNIGSHRLVLWNKSSVKQETIYPAFSEMKIAEKNDNSSEAEARIVTSNGLSIFIPISCLSLEFLTAMGGLSV